MFLGTFLRSWLRTCISVYYPCCCGLLVASRVRSALVCRPPKSLTNTQPTRTTLYCSGLHKVSKTSCQSTGSTLAETFKRIAGCLIEHILPRASVRHPSKFEYTWQPSSSIDIPERSKFLPDSNQCDLVRSDKLEVFRQTRAGDAFCVT